MTTTMTAPVKSSKKGNYVSYCNTLETIQVLKVKKVNGKFVFEQF